MAPCNTKQLGKLAPSSRTLNVYAKKLGLARVGGPLRMCNWHIAHNPIVANRHPQKSAASGPGESRVSVNPLYQPCALLAHLVNHGSGSQWRSSRGGRARAGSLFPACGIELSVHRVRACQHKTATMISRRTSDLRLSGSSQRTRARPHLPCCSLPST